MIHTSRTLLHALAADLSSGISPARWDLSIDDVLRSLAHVTGDADLDTARLAVAIFLEGTPSGAGLDLAYGAPDAPTGFREMCADLVAEIERERSWFASHPETWASSLSELREVLGEFDRLTAELRRVSLAVV